MTKDEAAVSGGYIGYGSEDVADGKTGESMYHVMFLGQKPLGEKCLNILKGTVFHNIRIAAIVSNISADDVWWKSNMPYCFAQKNNIPCIGNEKRYADEIKDCIIKNKINFLISVGHNWIIDKETINMVQGNAVNLHLAMLPMYQGNFTYNHAILNREKEYGVTLHFMQEEVDTGDYIFMPRFKISDKDTAYSLYQKSMNLGMTAFEEFVHILDSNEEIPRHKMIGEAHFYDRHSIDGKREIKDISNISDVVTRSRAFYFPPFENAYFINQGTKYYIQPEVEASCGY